MRNVYETDITKNLGNNRNLILLGVRADADIHHLKKNTTWRPIETLDLGGDAVLLYAEKWIDEDFNPKGIREGFRNGSDDGPIYSAKWNDCHECWETDVSHEATHWMPRPESP